MKTSKQIKYLFSDSLDFPRKVVFALHRRCDSIIKRGFYSFFGKRSLVYKLARVIGAKNIWIGNDVTINRGAYLYALKIADEEPQLIIGNGTTIGFYSHIVSVGKVNIGSEVLIADKVYIGDNAHCYEDINIPIIDQGVKYTGAVEIGEGTWIGDNVSIVSCKIGKHCIIGANSFVNSDMPDYSLVGGNPARVIKKYDHNTKRWEKI